MFPKPFASREIPPPVGDLDLPQCSATKQLDAGKAKRESLPGRTRRYAIASSTPAWIASNLRCHWRPLGYPRGAKRPGRPAVEIEPGLRCGLDLPPGRRRMDEVEAPVFLGLVRQLDPGLGHVDQHGLGAGLTGAFGQPKAFQRILAIMIGCAHGVASAAIHDLIAEF